MKQSNIKQKIDPVLSQRMLDCEEVVMTLDDAGVFLSKSREAVKKMCIRGVIPAHKTGKTWYLLKSEVVQRLRCL